MSEEATQRRSRKRRKILNVESSRSSRLQFRLETAVQNPGANRIQRIRNVLRQASVQDLNDLHYSPLTAVISFLGSRYTRTPIPAAALEDALELIQLCHDRGLSLDMGDEHVGRCYQRPLVEAAYWGILPIVSKLLDLKATPGLADGEGRTVLFAALQNPSGKLKLRDCDEQVAELLLQRKLVTASLRDWRKSTPGSVVYINQAGANGSALFNAIKNKNQDVVNWLVAKGAVMTDHDYLALRKQGKLNLLERAVGHNNKSIQCSPDVDWSFPPTWKVAVQLSSYCGLDKALFLAHVAPYCGRDWFYPQLDAPQPGLLVASMGEEDECAMRHRSRRWIHRRK